MCVCCVLVLCSWRGGGGGWCMSSSNARHVKSRHVHVTSTSRHVQVTSTSRHAVSHPASTTVPASQQITTNIKKQKTKTPPNKKISRSLSDVNGHPELAEDDVRAQDLVLEGGPAPAGLPSLGRLLQLAPDAAHGTNGGTLELGNLAPS